MVAKKKELKRWVERKCSMKKSDRKRKKSRLL